MSYFIDMWLCFKKWIFSFFKKEEVCSHCGRRLFDYERGKNKCYPMLTNGKIEKVHRECLYSYLFKKLPRKECDYIYKCLTE